MIFRRRLRASAAGLLILASPALWAKDGLGEVHSAYGAGNAGVSSLSNAGAASNLNAHGARRMLAQQAAYSVDEVQLTDGSRVRRYVAGNGQIFAVSWNTLYKPDLSKLLGAYFSGYAGAAQLAGQKGGIQRQFRHEGTDLVVQSGGHLHVFSGYAYLRSALPPGVSLQSLGWE